MRNKVFKTILIIIFVLIILAIPIVFFTMYAGEDTDDGKEYECYVATEISSAGDELTDEGIQKYLGVSGKEHVMALYLKKTGDCGIYAIDRGALGTWKKTDEGITVSAFKKKLKFKREWGLLILRDEVRGNKVVIKLEKKDKVPKCFRNHPEYTYGMEYNAEKSEKLCNFMLDGYYTRDGNQLYGMFFDSKGNSVLGNRQISLKGKPSAGKLNIIASDGIAKFLTVHNEYLYYMWVPTDNSEECICRVSLEGGKPEVLREGPCDYVQVRYNRIYFTDEDYRLKSVSLDGKKEKSVIDKEIYMPYVVDRNWIIYQDDADNERLHLCTLDGKYDAIISSERSYEWAIKGRTMYFTSTPEKTETGKHKCRLHKLSIDDFKDVSSGETPGTEKGEKFLGDAFALNSRLIFGGDGESVKLADWKTLSNTEYDSTGEASYLMFVSNRYKVCVKMGNTGEVSEIRLVDLKNSQECDLLK